MPREECEGGGDVIEEAKSLVARLRLRLQPMVRILPRTRMAGIRTRLLSGETAAKPSFPIFLIKEEP